MMLWKMKSVFLSQLVGVLLCIVCVYVFIVCIQCVSRPAHLSYFFLSSICSFTDRHPDRDPGSQLHLSQLHRTMGSLMPGHWPLILVPMLLLQIQPVKVQGVDPMSQKLRRLNKQVCLNQCASVCTLTVANFHQSNGIFL